MDKIDPFGDHKADKNPGEGKTILFTPGGSFAVSTWEPKQGTSFRGGKPQ